MLLGNIFHIENKLLVTAGKVCKFHRNFFEKSLMSTSNLWYNESNDFS